MLVSELTNKVIGVAIKVHKILGPGLLEHVYKECLFQKLSDSGVYVQKEYPLPVIFEGEKLECGFRIDLLVESRLVLEIKSIETLADIHTAQLLTYLKLGNFDIGLLINFNCVLLKHGIKRIVNNYVE